MKKRWMWFVLAVLMLGAGWAEARPNVVILYADDFGWGDIGIHNTDPDH